MVNLSDCSCLWPVSDPGTVGQRLGCRPDCDICATKHASSLHRFKAYKFRHDISSLFPTMAPSQSVDGDSPFITRFIGVKLLFLCLISKKLQFNGLLFDMVNSAIRVWRYCRTIVIGTAGQVVNLKSTTYLYTRISNDRWTRPLQSKSQKSTEDHICMVLWP